MQRPEAQALQIRFACKPAVAVVLGMLCCAAALAQTQVKSSAEVAVPELATSSDPGNNTSTATVDIYAAGIRGTIEYTITISGRHRTGLQAGGSGSGIRSLATCPGCHQVDGRSMGGAGKTGTAGSV